MGDIPAPVGSSYVGKNETQIEVDHKLGVGNYVIKEADGTVLFEVRGPTFVARDVRRMIGDASGNDLILLKNKVCISGSVWAGSEIEMWSWHDRWFAYRGTDEWEDNLLFTMSKCSVFQITPCFEIFLPENETSTPDFTVKGNFWERNYKVFYNGATIAQARKRFSLAYPLAVGKDHYGVTLYPGVDRAFIAAVVVIINEVKEDKRREIPLY